MGAKTIWTEEKALLLLDDLIKWMNEDVQLYYKGMPTEKVKRNVFWKEFFYSQGIFESVLYHLKNKFPSFAEKLEDIEKFQEHRLQKLSFEGFGKEQITKFILQNRYNWKEKSETENKNIDITWSEIKNYSSGSK